MLKKMDGRLEAVTNEVRGIKQMLTVTNTGKPSFQMESSSFKKKLNIFLKNQFTKIPWLDIKTDTEFKNEVNRNLKNDGYTNDAMAFKSVITWSSGRYTDYRNQLRRKIITELKKQDLAVVPIEEFAQSIIGGYCSSGVDVSSPERIQLCLLLRSFLYKKGMLTQDSLKLEMTADFWHSFKEYYDEFKLSVKEDKWEALYALDRRRTKQKDKEN